MLLELVALQDELGTTFVYVTHDQSEALTVADDMAIMNHDGKIEQVGKNVNINYKLQGKYGSGIFVAPRKGDYIDMEKDYKAYLNIYNQRLKSNIRNELLKK